MRRIFVLLVVSGAALAGGAPASADSIQQCPVVVENTNLRTDCLGPMVVANDKVNVNLGDHQVVCQNKATTDGIVLIARVDVHIENGHVHNCRNGIVAALGGDNDFDNLHVDGNNTGILLDRSDGNDLRNIYALDNSTRGVHVASSDANHLIDIVALRNVFEGIRLSVRAPIAGQPFPVSTGNRLERIVANDNQRDGIAFTDNTSGNVLRSSTALRNGRVGLFLFGTRNEIWSSRFSYTTGLWTGTEFFKGTGLFVTGLASSANELMANVAEGNAQNGIHVQGGRMHELQANRAVGNALDGLAVGNGPEQATSVLDRLKANFATSNGRFDLADYPPGPCTLNTWISNQGEKLYNGCETG